MYVIVRWSGDDDGEYSVDPKSLGFFADTDLVHGLMSRNSGYCNNASKLGVPILGCGDA